MLRPLIVMTAPIIALSLLVLPAEARKSAATSSEAASGNPADPVVAQVNGDFIHRSDVEAVLRSIMPQGQTPSQADLQKIYPALINDMISRKLAYQEAMREGVQNQSDVKHAMAMAQQQIVVQAYFNKIGTPAVTDDKLKQAYDEAIKTEPKQDEVHARQIMTKSEDEANAIIKQLDGGADFEKLAKEKSTDKNGGDLGYFTKGSMDPAVADAAFALAPGSYTKTPVKTSLGYDVIQSVDKRPAKVPTFEEAKGQLRTQVAQRAIKTQLVALSKTASIKVFNPDGSVPTQQAPAMPPAPNGAPASPSGATPAPAPSATPGQAAPLQLPQTQSTP